MGFVVPAQTMRQPDKKWSQSIAILRMEKNDLATANWLLETCKQNGIDPAKGMKFLTTHYRATTAACNFSAIRREFLRERGADSAGHSQHRHLRTSLRDFTRSLSREKVRAPELITEQDCRDWLARWLPPACEKKTWNEKLGYLHGLLLYAVRKDYLPRAPTSGIKRFKIRRTKVPAVLDPMAAQRLMTWLEEHAPQWIPYFAFCLFAGMRPDVREGEAHRLDHDIHRPSVFLGRPAMNASGFWLRGKTGRTRHVKWSHCGPLRAWLMAYPATGGIVPEGLTYAQAERELQAIRAANGLTHDILRHTAATARINMEGASFAQVALDFDNSEKMLRDHYLGIWEDGATVAFYGILPARVASVKVA